MYVIVRDSVRIARVRSKEANDVSIPVKLDGTRVQVITITNFPAEALRNTKRRLAEIAVYGLASDRRATRKISPELACPGSLCPLILSFVLSGNLMEF